MPILLILCQGSWSITDAGSPSKCRKGWFVTQQWDDRFEAALRKVVPALAPDEPLLPDLDLAAYGLGSIGIVQLMMTLEREYDVEFSFELLNFSIFSTPSALWRALGDVFGSTDLTTKNAT